MAEGVSTLRDPVAHRLNVDHLSTGLGDHGYLWRSSRYWWLICWRPDWWPGGAWFWHIGNGECRRISNFTVHSREGERFIRVGQVLLP